MLVCLQPPFGRTYLVEEKPRDQRDLWARVADMRGLGPMRNLDRRTTYSAVQWSEWQLINQSTKLASKLERNLRPRAWCKVLGPASSVKRMSWLGWQGRFCRKAEGGRNATQPNVQPRKGRLQQPGKRTRRTV